MSCVDLTWNLELLAGVAYAKSLWEKPKIQIKVTEVLASSWCHDPALAAVTETVVKEVYEAGLPNIISVFVAHIVLSMGRKIIQWDKYLQSMFHVNLKCIDAIYWTSVGEIDEVRIFRKWFSDKELASKNFNVLYDVAHRCAELEFVEKHCKNLQQFLKHSYRSCRKSVSSENVIFGKSKEEEFCIRQEIESGFLALKMLSISIAEGNDIAAKFYWGKMSVVDQGKNLMSIAVECLGPYSKDKFTFIKQDFVRDFIKEKRVMILMFLMSKMSQEQFEMFLVNNKYHILIDFLLVWPAQHFYIQFLQKTSGTIYTYLYIIILKDILCCLTNSYRFGINLHQNFYLELFERVWLDIPKYGKPKSIYNDFKDIIGLLFEQRNLKGIKFIINNYVGLENIKDVVIDAVQDKLTYLVMGEKFEELDIIMNEIFNDDEEEKKIKRKLNFYDHLIIYGKLCTADKLLCWQLSAGGERQELISSKIDCEKLCRILLDDNRFSSAENFLKWVFEDEGKVDNFKDIFRSDDFIRGKIYSIWSTDISKLEVDSKERHTLNFLKWVSMSDNEINEFRVKKLIANAKCIEKFCQKLNFSNPGSKEALIQFFGFCEVKKEKILQILKEVFEPIGDNSAISYYKRYKNDFRMIEFLVNWSAENEDERKIVAKILMNSANAIDVWYNIRTNEDNVLRFYNEWIKESSDITDLKNEVLRRIKDSPTFNLRFVRSSPLFYHRVCTRREEKKIKYRSDYYLYLKSIFEKLENGYDIYFS